MLSFAGRVGKAIAQLVPIRTDDGTVEERLVVNFSVAMNTFVNGKERTTWVWMSVWQDQAEAFIKHRPSFIIAHGLLYAEQYEKNGVPGTQLKLHQPHITWGPKDGNNCEIDDRRTNVASNSNSQTPDVAAIAAALGADPAVIAEVMKARASAPAPATPAAEAPIEIGFDLDGDPF